jgi:PAS domain S-box-containing protein
MDKTRILIVEDEVVIAMELKGMIEDLGCEVTAVVNSGTAAVKQAGDDRPHIVLMDIGIKGATDGIEAARLTRSEYEIPVVFLTAHMDEVRIERAKMTMPFGYVLKPIQPRELKVTLEMALYVAKIEIERKRVEARSLEIWSLLETAIAASPSGILIADAPDVTIRVANPAAFGIRGGDRSLLTGIAVTNHAKHWQTFRLDGSEYPSEALPLSRAVLKGEIINNEEVIIRDETGQDHIVSANAAPIRNEAGQITAGIVVFHDITESKKAEAALKVSEVKYRTVVDNAIEAICVIQDNLFVYFNPQAIELFGYPAMELACLPTDRTVYPPDRDRVLIHRSRQWTENHPSQSYSHRIVTKDGKVRWVDIKAVTLSWDQRPAVLAFLTDITERKRSEEMMIQTEKMLSLGGLAAGMAHELNNPLGGILQGAQNVLRRLSPGLPANHRIAEETGIDLNGLQHYLEKREIISFINGIQESGRKASRIITSMLQFSRRSESKMAPTNLVDLVENVLELAGKDYNLKKKHDFRNIDIVREYTDNLPLVPCTQTEIEQVVLNLLTNAGWAIAAWGQQCAPRITLRIWVEADVNAVIEVEDNGPGMDEETRKKTFEPFFTTKPVGEGTGLGLSVSYMIITNNHGGSLEVESEPGKGARFIIRLPLKRRTGPTSDPPSL